MVAAAVTAAAAIGASAIGSRASNRAADRASDTAAQTAAQNIAFARENRDLMRSYVDPLVPYAYQGAGALANRVGLTAPPPANTNIFAPQTPGINPNAPQSTYTNGQVAGPFGAPAAPPSSGGGIDYNRVRQERPDVVAEFERARAAADQNSPAFRQKGLDSFENYVGYWQQNRPAADNYQLPQSQAQAPAAPVSNPFAQPQPAQPSGPQTPYGLDGFTDQAPTFGERAPANRPDAAPAPTFTRPDAGPAPAFARPDQPTFNDPGSYGEFSFNPGDLANDPGYKFRQEQGMRGVNSGFAARGLLKSGGALKGALDFNSGLASQEYQNAFNRALAAWQANASNRNTDRQTSYNIFSDERNNLNRNAETDYGFATDAYRYDTNRRDTNFNSDRGYGTDVWRYGVDRADRNYDLDITRADARYDADRNFNQARYTDARNFAANRFDRQTNDLFTVTGIGTGAINSLNGVNNNFTNQAINSNTYAGDAAANAQLIAGSNTANLFGQAAQGIGQIYTAYQNRGNPFAQQPAGTTGTVNYGNSLNNYVQPRVF